MIGTAAGRVSARALAVGGVLLLAAAGAEAAFAQDGDPLDRRHAEFLDAVAPILTETPTGAEARSAEIALRYPGRRGSRTVVQAIVGIDPAHLPESAGETRRFVLDGEVLRQGELFEQFRYRFEPPARTGGETAPIPLVTQRYLRPGPYRLVVKVRDLETDRFFSASTDIDVPLVPPPEPAAAGPDGKLPAAGVADWLAEATAAMPRPAESSGEHTVRIHALPERLVTGRIRVGADAEGPNIRRLAFSLDGRELLSKRRPPYQVEIDVGPSPRAHSLRVDAYGPQGGILATDEVRINSGPHRFAVRLVSPRRGAAHVRSVRAAAEVEAPRHERLDRVEFFLNDRRTATLYQPPFEQPIRIDPAEPLSYVRAVAYLDTGAWAEDIVFVNSRNLVEEIEVALIELHVSVTDRSGAPVRDLAGADFEVFVDGERQPLERFDNAVDQPIHACILFDTSLSMQARLQAAEEAALHFFERVLGPRDRACLITFNDRHELAVGFTGSRETLAGGLADLAAEGETALYDSVLHALYHFGGLRGKRALILLTDGEDSGSEHSFDDVLEFARRSQVAVYSIGVDIDGRELRFRGQLQELCKETGGRCFFIVGASELPRVYERIESEVRSRYLLVFESPERGGDTFRQVEVKLTDGRGRGRRGMRIHHLPGFFQ